MNPNAIITKGKSSDVLLQRHLEQNGHLRDEYTDENDAQSKQCLQDLRATHWTQETEELRNKWKQTPEDMERIRKNVQIIK